MAQWADQTPVLFLNGKSVPRFCGAEGDGGAGQGGDGGQNQDDKNNSNGQQGGSGSQSGSEQSGQGGGQGAPPATVSKAEYDALMARMQAADKNYTAGQARIKELEDKDKSELEKAQADAAAAKKEADELKQNRTDMLTSNAFLIVKDSPTWHNSSAALALLDKSLITVKEDGTVEGMEAAVKKLAADHPYLVKPAGDGKDDKDGKNGNQQASGSSNNGGGGGGKAPDRAKLEKRFPALRGRGVGTS